MLLNIGAVYLYLGRCRHQEGPRRRNNFCWSYMLKFQSVWVPSREGIKNGRQQTCNLGPSAHFY